MIRINLLPHREEKRKARQRRYMSMLLMSALVAIAVWIVGYTYLAARIDGQNERNQMLTDANAKLDKQIQEIERLKSEKQALLDRKAIVEQLQANRTAAVHLMDQLTRQVPEGVYLTSVSQTGEQLALVGMAQSNARVSTLMRNLNDSPTFEQPLLIEVKAASVGNQRLSNFTLNIKMTTPESAASAAAAQPVKKAGG